VSLSKQDLKDIYTCAKTDWSQFGLPAGPIIPWDMNTSSGTLASFKLYLDNITFGACVRKQVGATNGPFENDVKPILADPGPDTTFGTADDDENNYIWWMSFGNWQTYPFTKNGLVNGTGAPIASNLVTVAGTVPSDSTIFDSSYAIMRSLYQVTRDAEADCRQAPGTAGACDNAANTVYGATSGKAGAVREFTQWLCRSTASSQAVNTVTGQNYRNAIIGAVNAEGFQVLSAGVPGLRTAGYSCEVITQ
jgi:ABC-type phosphate transport system substrate-binding protein